MIKTKNNEDIVVALRLRDVSTRINTLSERLKQIKEDGKVIKLDGYVPGYYSRIPFLSFREIFFSDIQFQKIVSAVANKYGEDSDHAKVEYHYYNVVTVIQDYFSSLVEGHFEPSPEVLDDMVKGAAMVADVLFDIAGNILADEL